MIIPHTNPIRFNVLPPQQMDGEHWYFQKFQQSDFTAVQILVDNAEPTQDWGLAIFNSYGVIIYHYPILVTEFTTLVAGIKIIEFHFDFSRLAEDLYYFVLSGGNTKFYSDFLCVKAQHEDTKLITYRNSANDQSVIFATGIRFNIRVEAHDRHTPKTLVPKSVDSIYSNDLGGYMTLYANPFETYRINIGGVRGIPDYLEKIVNRAFGCDTLLLDNNKINKVESAAFEAVEAENYPLRSWIIEVGYSNEDITYATATYKSPICQKNRLIFISATYVMPLVCQKIEQTTTYPTAEWTAPTCHKMDDSLTYPIATWTEPVCQQINDFVMLRIHLAKASSGFTTPSTYTIGWAYHSEVPLPASFKTMVRLNAVYQFQSGLLIGEGNIDIEFIAKVPDGKLNQEISQSQLNGFISVSDVKLYPSEVNGIEIQALITLS